MYKNVVGTRIAIYQVQYFLIFKEDIVMKLDTLNTLKTLTVAAMFACGISAQTAMAADAAKVDPDFAKLDANKDGKISLKEAAKDKGLSASFDAVDANKDGSVAGEEFAAFKTASTGAAAPAEPAATN